MVTFSKIEQLKSVATEIRVNTLKSLAEAGSGHTGGSLGLADIFTALYFYVLNHDPKNPDWADRDRMVLSIGHVAPVFYATLAEAGYFDKSELMTLRKLGSRLQGHPGREHGLPGIELSAGSLGQGLSVAVGMALAAKADKKQHRIFCVNGDGELQEGSVWEAIMSAGHYQLDNLLSIVDRNRVQIDGPTSEVMGLEPLKEKFESFGWEVMECEGNNMEHILRTFALATKTLAKPTVILAETTMGKGVAEIEGDYRWHGKPPKKDQLESFINQVKNAAT
ncbi:MAG: transketolase [Bacteroidales bacterium]|nr:transketolase [Bacteroidales bacterium]